MTSLNLDFSDLQGPKAARYGNSTMDFAQNFVQGTFGG
jgi:hypothetical protein